MRDSVSVVFLESPMALASSGRPPAAGAPSVVVDSMLVDTWDAYGAPRHDAVWNKPFSRFGVYMRARY